MLSPTIAVCGKKLQMKRREERQLRREDVDDDADDEPEEQEQGGQFARASSDVIAGRRIVKTRRSSAATAVATTMTPFSSTSTNPFANFDGVSGQKSNSSNPFLGFSGLTSKPLESSAAPISAQKAKDSIPTEKIDGTAKISDLSAGDEAKKRICKLNKSFLAWMDRQIVEHPLSIWKDGLLDYIKYANEIVEKYGAPAPLNGGGALAVSTSKEAVPSSAFSFSSGIAPKPKDTAVVPSIALPPVKETIGAPTFSFEGLLGSY